MGRTNCVSAETATRMERQERQNDAEAVAERRARCAAEAQR